MNTDRVDTFDIEDAELWVACNCHLPDVVKTLFAAIAALRANQSALPEVTEGFYLADFEGNLRDEVLWWRPNNCGYTTDLAEAGIYTEIKPGYHDSERTVPVPVAFVKTQRISQILSREYQGTIAWWNALTLRQEIESYRARLLGAKP